MEPWSIGQIEGWGEVRGNALEDERKKRFLRNAERNKQLKEKGIRTEKTIQSGRTPPRGKVVKASVEGRTREEPRTRRYIIEK